MMDYIIVFSITVPVLAFWLWMDKKYPCGYVEVDGYLSSSPTPSKQSD